ncbi:MAG: hypothetical protein KM296_00145 [Brockia lithotrophica]|nr:hypothetical protein [Brockia lithotrophica]
MNDEIIFYDEGNPNEMCANFYIKMMNNRTIFYDGHRVPTEEKPFFDDFLWAKEQRGQKLPPPPWFLEVVHEFTDKRGRKIKVVKIHPPEEVKHEFEEYDPRVHRQYTTYKFKEHMYRKKGEKMPHNLRNGVCTQCGYDAREIVIGLHDDGKNFTVRMYEHLAGTYMTWDNLKQYAEVSLEKEIAFPFIEKIREDFLQISRNFGCLGFEYPYKMKDELIDIAQRILSKYKEKYEMPGLHKVVPKLYNADPDLLESLETKREIFNAKPIPVIVKVNGEQMVEKHLTLDEYLKTAEKIVFSDKVDKWFAFHSCVNPSYTDILGIFNRDRIEIDIEDGKKINGVEFVLLVFTLSDEELVWDEYEYIKFIKFNNRGVILEINENDDDGAYYTVHTTDVFDLDKYIETLAERLIDDPYFDDDGEIYSIV